MHHEHGCQRVHEFRRRIVLANGLTALLISDPEMADAVAAADDDDGDADGNAGDSEEVGLCTNHHCIPC